MTYTRTDTTRVGSNNYNFRSVSQSQCFVRQGKLSRNVEELVPREIHRSYCFGKAAPAQSRVLCPKTFGKVTVRSRTHLTLRDGRYDLRRVFLSQQWWTRRTEHPRLLRKILYFPARRNIASPLHFKYRSLLFYSRPYAAFSPSVSNTCAACRRCRRLSPLSFH